MKYKFLRLVDGKIKSQNGSQEWEIGKWYKEKALSMCLSGFHCSNTILDAMQYVKGEILAIVETRGKCVSRDNKECWQKMKIVKAYRWTKKDSIMFAIFCAELTLKNYEKMYPNDMRPRQAIEAAKKVLEDDNKKNKGASWTVKAEAKAAACSAELAALSVKTAIKAAEESIWGVEGIVKAVIYSAEAAAWAAEAASESEAEAAAWAASESIVWSVWSAGATKEVMNSIETWLVNHIKDLEEII